MDNKKQCAFCEMLNYLQAHQDAEIECQYRVALLEDIFKDGQFRGRSSYGRAVLKFCPTCGKKIKRSKK